ncbi:MAG: hypothetical protein ABIG95_04360 [Candidatus Woesearchaeota archaeon]
MGLVGKVLWKVSKPFVYLGLLATSAVGIGAVGSGYAYLNIPEFREEVNSRIPLIGWIYNAYTQIGGLEATLQQRTAEWQRAHTYQGQHNALTPWTEEGQQAVQNLVIALQEAQNDGEVTYTTPHGAIEAVTVAQGKPLPRADFTQVIRTTTEMEEDPTYTPFSVDPKLDGGFAYMRFGTKSGMHAASTGIVIPVSMINWDRPVSNWLEQFGSAAKAWLFDIFPVGSTITYEVGESDLTTHTLIGDGLGIKATYDKGTEVQIPGYLLEMQYQVPWDALSIESSRIISSTHVITATGNILAVGANFPSFDSQDLEATHDNAMSYITATLASYLGARDPQQIQFADIEQKQERIFITTTLQSGVVQIHPYWNQENDFDSHLVRIVDQFGIPQIPGPLDDLFNTIWRLLDIKELQKDVIRQTPTWPAIWTYQMRNPSEGRSSMSIPPAFVTGFDSTTAFDPDRFKEGVTAPPAPAEFAGIYERYVTDAYTEILQQYIQTTLPLLGFAKTGVCGSSVNTHYVEPRGESVTMCVDLSTIVDWHIQLPLAATTVPANSDDYDAVQQAYLQGVTKAVSQITIPPDFSNVDLTFHIGWSESTTTK